MSGNPKEDGMWVETPQNEAEWDALVDYVVDTAASEPDVSDASDAPDAAG